MLREDRRVLRSRIEGMLSLALLLVPMAFLGACPSGGAGAGAKSSGDVSAEGPCQRSLTGDIKTIRSRLARERPDEAAIYIDALEACAKAQASPDFLIIAAQVHEELGRLNAAWRSAAAAMRLVVEGEDARAIEKIKERLDRFRKHYVQIEGGGPSAVGPRIRYAGPVLDDVTFAQLAEVADNKYVELGPGSWGFWLYPGRYEIQGVSRVAKPGDRIELGRGGN